jgi:uncharacterized membrane protein
MNLLSNENGELIFKAVGALFAFLSLRWVMKIFAGEDGKMDKHELKKVTAFLFFLWAAIYIIVKEANRPASTEHIFSDIWIFFIISGLLTVLSLEKIFESLGKLIEAIVKLRTPIPVKNEEKTD